MKSDSAMFRWRVSHWATVLFLVLIFMAVNYIGFKRHFRVDCSTNQFLSLSEQTRKVLANLPEEVEITHFQAEKQDTLALLLYEDLSSLLEEYEFLSGGKVKLKKVNSFIHFDSARQIAEKYKLTNSENVIIISLGERSKVLKVAEMAEFDTSGLVHGDYPTIKQFKAEPLLTGAIMGLVSGKKSKVYFTVGHGEADPDSKDETPEGISILASRIRSQNVEIAKLDFVETPEVPEDADLLVIMGPRYRFVEDEALIIKDYLKRHGKLFILLAPQYISGLEDVLKDYGVVFNTDLVLRPAVALTEQGALQAGISPDALAVEFAEHPAIDWIRQTGSRLNFKLSRSISILGDDPKSGTETISLARTADNAWGETTLGNIKEMSPVFDEGADFKGPLALAVLVDEGAVPGSEVSLKGTRAVAVGSSSMMVNKQITTLQADFFLNGMNWLLEQEQALGITAKVPQEFSVEFSPTQKQTLGGLVLLVPLAGMVVGALVWFRRRK